MNKEKRKRIGVLLMLTAFFVCICSPSNTGFSTWHAIFSAFLFGAGIIIFFFRLPKKKTEK